MKHRYILFILLLSLGLLFCCGCASDSSEQSALMTADESAEEVYEDVTGIFEGLEGNHTAVFSFDGVETAFHFEAPEVQQVLFEAIVGSSYTLSYYLDTATGLYTITEITES